MAAMTSVPGQSMSGRWRADYLPPRWSVPQFYATHIEFSLVVRQSQLNLALSCFSAMTLIVMQDPDSVRLLSASVGVPDAKARRMLLRQFARDRSSPSDGISLWKGGD
jgi:hypothetical protein